MKGWVAQRAVLVMLLLSVPAGAVEIVVPPPPPSPAGGQDADSKNEALPDGAIAQSGALTAAPVEDPGVVNLELGSSTSPSSYQLAISPDGRRAAAAGDDGKVRILDTATAKLLTTIQAHRETCHAVCFAPDGQTVYSCSADHTVRRWDLATGKQVGEFGGLEGHARSIACAPDGEHLATSDSRGIRIYDLKTGKLLHSLAGHKVPKLPGDVEREYPLTVDALVFSPNGRTLFSEANDETARMWDALSGKALRVLPQHDGATAAVALSPDGTLGVSTRGALRQMPPNPPRLRIWEVGTGKILRTLWVGTGNITCDAFSPDGRYVLSGSEDCTLRQWEVDSGVEVRRYQLSSPPRGVAYHPGGRFALTLSAKEGLVVWDMALAPKLRELNVGLANLDDAWQKLGARGYEVRAAAFNYYCANYYLTKVAPAEAAADLCRRLQGKAVDEAARAAQRRLIAQLDDPAYTARVRACDELAQLGESAREELAAAAEHPSAEVRARVGALLEAIGGPADFRSVLALEILALLKTPAAQAELERVAASGLPCATHAKALLARMNK
ncbi:MAG: WD40 repeat domain-containing protein [Planctomycetota bacterium]